MFQTLKPRLKLAKMRLKQGPQITEVNKVSKQSTIYQQIFIVNSLSFLLVPFKYKNLINK